MTRPSAYRTATVTEPATTTAPRVAGVTASPVGRPGDLAAEIDSLYGGSPSRKKVLLFGNYGRGNLGDEGNLAAMLAHLAPVADVTVVSRSPAAVSRLHDIKSVKLLSPRGVLALLGSDHLAIGGGMFSHGGNLAVSVLLVVIRAARRLGKKTVFLATGAYSSSPPRLQRRLRRLAARSLFVSVRDLESAAVLGRGPETVIVEDPGITLTPAPAEAGRAALAAAGVRLDRPLLGVSLKPTPYRDRNHAQVSAAAAACAWWRENTGGDCVLLVLSARGEDGAAASDQTLLDAVADRTAGLGGISKLGPDLSPDVMKAAIGQLRLMVGHRLPAQIYAWSMAVPVIGISYERESDSFLETRRLRRVDLWALEPGRLTEVLAAMTSRAATSAAVRTVSG